MLLNLEIERELFPVDKPGSQIYFLESFQFKTFRDCDKNTLLLLGLNLVLKLVQNALQIGVIIGVYVTGHKIKTMLG
jgi:hypothetical protein